MADVWLVDNMSSTAVSELEESKEGGGLRDQNLETLDPTQLSPLTPEVISRQATINIGTIGHVSHGKSSLVRALSGVKTQRHSTERIRNITIKLGYANAKIFKCANPACAPPGNYTASGSATGDRPVCQRCKGEMILQRHVSFVDCPGHDILMATMLNGAAVMDAALLLVAANEPCPQPQTCEHLAAIEIMDLNNIIILQNKIDIAFRNDSARHHYDQIKAFVNKTKVASAPIIPISAQLRYNIDCVCQYICSHIPIPVRDFTSTPRLIVIRSFDVNRPGEEVKDLKGGVAGGSILRGVFRMGDEVEIRPGIILKSDQGKMKCNPLRSRIVTLCAEKNELKYAVPGGLIGVGLLVDPSITRADNLVGHVLGHPGQLPEVYNEIEIQYYLLKRLVGVRNASLPKMDRVLST